MTRRHYCRSCSRETQQTLVQAVNGNRPAHELWRCDACGLSLLTIENVLDVEGICDRLVSALERSLAGGGRHDFDDARLYLREQAWIAYADWHPEKCASFLAFASERLRLRLLDWIRRSTPEQFLYAASLDRRGGDDSGAGDGDWLDADRDPLRVPVGSGAGHDHDDSLADLRRAVVQRDRDRARRG